MKIELYLDAGCAFCKKVMKVIDDNNWKSKVEYHDILKDKKDYDALMKINDNDEQVPCLVVDGKPMLESDDIIRWLKQNLV